MGVWPFKTNFCLIAENTTKYYMELKSRYSQVLVQLEQYAKLRERGLWGVAVGNNETG